MTFAGDAQRWSEATFGQCNLGDKRLKARLIDYGARQAAAPAASTNQLAGGDAVLAEGMYRFMRNDRVEPSALAEGGFRHTASLCKGRELVLLPEDSTALSYTHSVAESLGDIGGPKGSKSRGFYVHSVLAVDDITGEVLGLLEQQRWIRSQDRPGRANRGKIPYEQKESFKWQQASQQVHKRLGSMENVISVCDREADLHEYLQYKLRENQRFVVRASYDRCVGGEQGHLFASVLSWPVAGGWKVHISQRGAWKGPKKTRPARKARSASLEVRFGAVNVTVSESNKSKTPDRKSLPLFVVHVREPHPPAGESALEWFVLTSEPVLTLEDAQRVLRIYERRWIIEEFHDAWKNGCGVENRRQQEPDNLERLAVILAFVAVYILQLRALRDEAPTTPCDRILTQAQWQCLWATRNPGKRLPQKAPSVAWATEAIAALGGWRDTKRTGRIGWKSLWRGWEKLEERVEGWRCCARSIKG
jgi:hypothetical protein